MKIQGQQTLPASRDRVWKVLLDPEVLGRTLPGCEGLEAIGPDEYKMHMKLAIASVQGLFDGRVKLEDQQPPESYKLAVEGRGKVGFVKGGGAFRLEPAGANETLVHYEGDVSVGGLIAGVGQRLLDMTSKMMIKRFFNALAGELEKGS
jgi:carbon monoxide dehydrogenase subunit G